MPASAARRVAATPSQLARLGKLLHLPANLNRPPTTLPKTFGGSSAFLPPRRAGAPPLIAGPYPVYPGKLYAGADLFLGLASQEALYRAVPEIGNALAVVDAVDNALRLLPQGAQYTRNMNGWTFIGTCPGNGPPTNWFSLFKTGAQCIAAQAGHGTFCGPNTDLINDVNTYAHRYGPAYQQLTATRWDSVETWYSPGDPKGMPYNGWMPDYEAPPIGETYPQGNLPRVTYSPNPNIQRLWQKLPLWTRPDPTYKELPDQYYPPVNRPTPSPNIRWADVPGVGPTPTRTIVWEPGISVSPTPTPIEGVPGPSPAPSSPPAGGPGAGGSPMPSPSPTPTPYPPPVILPPPVRPSPPPARTKERKIRSTLGTLLHGLDTISELAEIVDAIYDALPSKTRRNWEARQRRLDHGARNPMIDNAGQYGIDGADWKLQAIWSNWDKIDTDEAWQNISRNILNDLYHGMLHKYGDRGTLRIIQQNPQYPKVDISDYVLPDQ